MYTGRCSGYLLDLDVLGARTIENHPTREGAVRKSLNQKMRLTNRWDKHKKSSFHCRNVQIRLDNYYRTFPCSSLNSSPLPAECTCESDSDCYKEHDAIAVFRKNGQVCNQERTAFEKMRKRSHGFALGGTAHCSSYPAGSTPNTVGLSSPKRLISL